ncbi:MAG: recombinase family protein [Lachnospiraceae bacterium]|nr:recombinase family protein [Lachnospiraceae bacterium]
MPKVTTIPPTKALYTRQPLTQTSKARVAAYARVSTDQEEQQSSYKAQMDYFTDLITSNPEWEFAGMYADEGITATSIKSRDGFNSMIKDALDGKIDSIITKSVSRFARNTVDSLTTIRKLKEKGIDVYFEKENIHTLDAKGELLITIMSSMAQEESRSISENSTWGIRKRMRDGKFSLAYSRFLGYDKGPDGKLVINEEQAKVVRRIFSEYISGKSSTAIAKGLQTDGIPTASGEGRWDCSAVMRILQNEKYKGDALIQKTYTESFLTHKAVKNNGELPSYYIEDDHEAIVSKEVFELAQVVRESKKKTNTYRKNIFSQKLVCAECGGLFTKTAWKSTKGYRQVFICYNRYGPLHTMCSTPHLEEPEIIDAFMKALNTALKDKDKVIQTAEQFIRDNRDTAALEKERDELREKISEIVSTISGNSTVVFDRIQYKAENEELYRQHGEINARYEAVLDELKQAKGNVAAGEEFLRYFTEMLGPIQKFNELYWDRLLDKMIVAEGKELTAVFIGGYSVNI